MYYDDSVIENRNDFVNNVHISLKSSNFPDYWENSLLKPVCENGLENHIKNYPYC